MKPFKEGLIIGKFDPPHIGHTMMIRFGLSMCEKMCVLVSGKEDDIILPVHRSFVISDHFVDEKNRLHMFSEYNDMEEGPKDSQGTVLDEDYWQYWIEKIKKKFPDVDALFTNDFYGERLAREIGAKWYPIDPERNFLNVSSTKIRNNMTSCWNYVIPEAKYAYGKRVAIVGPESSGKSTMAFSLSRNLPMAGDVSEYGRTLSEIRKNTLSKEDFIAILNGQSVAINAVQQIYPMVISDTEAITTYLFAKKYLMTPEDKNEVEKIAMNKAMNQIFDLYIVLSPDVEWVDDGWRIIRNRKEREEWFEDTIRILTNLKRNYVVITGNDFYERYQKARQHILDLL